MIGSWTLRYAEKVIGVTIVDGVDRAFGNAYMTNIICELSPRTTCYTSS